jgi:hypothetical protein
MLRRPSSTETNLKSQVMQMLAKEYPAAVVRKRHGTVYSTAGDPDLSILFHGVHIECELKRFGEKPTQLQLYRLGEWRKAGAVTAVVFSVADARRLMAGVAARSAGLIADPPPHSASGSRGETPG